MTALVVRGDARALPLPDASVDLVVTSPPYFGLRSYADGGQHYDGQIGSEGTLAEFLDELPACTREMARVLRPTGSIFVNLGDKYGGHGGGPGSSDGALRRARSPRHRRAGRSKSLMLVPERYRIACTDELDLIARAVIVWNKPTALPEPVTDRARRSHEDWVHLTVAERYYGDTNEIREPHTGGTHPAGRNATVTRWQSGQGSRHRTGRSDLDLFDPRGKLPGSVWTIGSQALTVPEHLGAEHHAAFPTEWPRRLIRAFCPPGGVVLDPFGGTGTTALVADVLDCTGITVDASADYGRIARWRTRDERERAVAAGNDRSAVAAPTVDAPSLFDLGGVS